MPDFLNIFIASIMFHNLWASEFKSVKWSNKYYEYDIQIWISHDCQVSYKSQTIFLSECW